MTVDIFTILHIATFVFTGLIFIALIILICFFVSWFKRRFHKGTMEIIGENSQIQEGQNQLEEKLKIQKRKYQGNPYVVNRRKSKRIPITNDCVITGPILKEPVTAKMLNISSNGFAFTTTESVFENKINAMIHLEVIDYKPLNGKLISAQIVRISGKDGDYTIGCRTSNEHKEIYD